MEEPESHLFPDAQKLIAMALGLFANQGNKLLVTTHSPYILGELNNMLYASQLQARGIDTSGVIAPLRQLALDRTAAGYLRDGFVDNALEEGFISNELIDGASDEINEEMEQLLDMRE